jgi:23S rRNA (guanosine2251-2'-O)-methyltransferase
MALSETILYGYHAVAEAIKAGRRTIFGVFLTLDKDSDRRDEIAGLAHQCQIPVDYKTVQQMTALVGHRRHQGIAARVSDYPFSSLEGLVSRTSQPMLLLVLDRILDPQNFGAMARTAQCVGANGMIISKNHSAPPSAAVSKVSAGAIEHIHVACVTNLVNALQQLKKAGVWIAGADRNGEVDLHASDLKGPLAIVIGGEEKGLRPLVRKQCDYILAIPQTGPIGSLNASVAAGVILYEAFRQRRGNC